MTENGVDYWRRRALEMRDAAASARAMAERLNERRQGPPIRWHYCLDVPAPGTTAPPRDQGDRAMRRHRLWDTLHEQSSLSAISALGMLATVCSLLLLDYWAMRHGIDLGAIISHGAGTMLAITGAVGTGATIYANIMRIVRPEAPVVVKAPETASVTDVRVTTEPTAPPAPPA